MHAFPIESSGGISSPFVQITVLSVGCRSFAMKMGCWLAGTCCWASSRLLLSTVRGLSIPMQMGCLDSVDNVGGWIVRYPLPIQGWLNWTPCRFYWISHSPRRNWRFHGRGFAAGAVWGNLGGSYVIGGTYSGLASGWIRY